MRDYVHIATGESDVTLYEYVAEAAAGVSINDGAQWWGTRVSYRSTSRRWEKITLVDIHPFDVESIEGYIALRVGGRVAPSAPSPGDAA
jgi:hypothetical protein